MAADVEATDGEIAGRISDLLATVREILDIYNRFGGTAMDDPLVRRLSRLIEGADQSGSRPVLH